MSAMKEYAIERTEFMHRKPELFSFRAVSNWTGYKWSFLIKQAITCFIDSPELGWTRAASDVKRVALELDY